MEFIKAEHYLKSFLKEMSCKIYLFISLIEIISLRSQQNQEFPSVKVQCNSKDTSLCLDTTKNAHTLYSIKGQAQR